MCKLSLARRMRNFLKVCFSIAAIFSGVREDRRRERDIEMSNRDSSSRVYIGDLGSGGSKPELEREFERYGPLKSVWVARNPPGELYITLGKKASFYFL